MLAAAQGEEAATRNPPLPASFFTIQACLIALICAAQALDSGVGRGLSALGVMGVFGMGLRFVFMRPGYGWVAPDGRDSFGFMLALLLLVAGPGIAAEALDVPALWLAAAVLGAAATVVMGRRYRKEFGGE